MKICVWHNDKTREILLAEAIRDGVTNAGEECELRLLTAKKEVADAQVAFMVGVKSLDLWNLHQKNAVHTVMLDKGYVRNRAAARSWKYWRVAVDHHNAAGYIGRAKHRSDRWDALGMEIKPWRVRGHHILFCGSSAKYHTFYGLRAPTTYATKIIKQIHKASGKKIVYRPKPSWHDAVPIDNSRFSKSPENITAALEGAWAMVTHGSNSCFEAILGGVPCIVLGEGIAKSISSQTIEEIHNPKMVNMKTRRRWASNLAYCQWTVPEFASGEAWEVIKPQIYGE